MEMKVSDKLLRLVRERERYLWTDALSGDVDEALENLERLNAEIASTVSVELLVNGALDKESEA